MLIAAMLLVLSQTSDLEMSELRTLEAEYRPMLREDRGYSRNGPAGPYYPERAYAARANGYGIIRCKVMAEGRLEACKPVSETPTNSNFAPAARIMAARDRVFVRGASVGETVLVRVPFVLGAPVVVEPPPTAAKGPLR